jgi:four helix bundle protein
MKKKSFSMATIKKFEDILSWQKARELNRLIGNIIDSGRFKQSYRHINQIEGSAGSMMDNIAEGFERGGNKEFLQYLSYSKGSCGEFRSQLYRALDRNFITNTEFEDLYQRANEVAGLIQKLMEYLENSEMKGPKYKSRN